MRDYYLIELGMFIADVPTDAIHHALNIPINAEGDLTAEAVRERLQLELFIRERNLRE